MYNHADPNQEVAFNRALRAQVIVPIVRATVYEVKRASNDPNSTDFNFVPESEGQFYDGLTKPSGVTTYIIDGSVDVDVSRGTRRTAELTLLSLTGENIPSDEWTGQFYINRFVGIERGLMMSNGERIYLPVGMFMLDHAEVIVERNMSLIVLSMSDLWKKFTKSVFAAPKTYAKGTHINTIIRDFATSAGADKPSKPALDPLTDPARNADNTTLNAKLQFQRGDNRGEKLKELAERFDIDIFFDVTGVLTSQDRNSEKDTSQVWHFYHSDRADGMLLTVRRNFNDDNLYNHVIAVGTGDEKTQYRYEKKDDDPKSKIGIPNIGDRVLLIEDETLKTQAAINRRGEAAWAKRGMYSQEITLETICHPGLDGDDMIRVTEGISKVQGLFRVKTMTVPLITSRQTITVSSERKIGNVQAA